MPKFIICLIGLSFLTFNSTCADEFTNRITILYDSFSKSTHLQKDWGFAAFIEFNGKRILFDAGNNETIFKENARAANIDLTRIDFVVISHRHGDHTTGLNYLFKVHPNVPVYTPNEKFGLFGSRLPGSFYPQVAELPTYLRTYAGNTLDHIDSGSPWDGANFIRLDETKEIFPDIFIISTISDTPGTLELQELTLALKTSAGLILVVGCSHPGIQNIVHAATMIDTNIVNIFGGFHLLRTPVDKISTIASTLKNQYKVKSIAPGHCTGEPAIKEFLSLFQDEFIYAGLGSTIELPQ